MRCLSLSLSLRISSCLISSHNCTRISSSPLLPAAWNMFHSESLLGHLLLKERVVSSDKLELNPSLVVSAPMPFAWSDSYSSLAPYRVLHELHVSSVEARGTRAEQAALVRQRVGRASLPPRVYADWFSNMLAHSNYTLQNVHPRFHQRPREQVVLVILGSSAGAGGGGGGLNWRPDRPDALLLAHGDAHNRSVRLEWSRPASSQQSLVRLPFTCDLNYDTSGVFERTRDVCSLIPLLTSAALSAREQLRTEVLFSSSATEQRFVSASSLLSIDAPNGSYVSLPLDTLLTRLPLPSVAPYLLKAQHRVSLRNHWQTRLVDEQSVQTLVMSARNALRVHTDAALVFEVRERMSTSASAAGNTLLAELLASQSCEASTPNAVQLRFENQLGGLVQRLVANLPPELAGVSFELSLQPMQHRLAIAALPAGATGGSFGSGFGSGFAQLPPVESLLRMRSVALAPRTEFAESLVLCANHSSFDAEESARLLDGTFSVDLNTTQSGVLRVLASASANSSASAGPLLVPLDFSVSTRLLGS